MLFYFLKTRQKELQAHGRTSDRNSEESFEQDADDVSGLLDFLKVEKADIFGFSNGGNTAFARRSFSEGGIMASPTETLATGFLNNL
jgi:hypothetical protein